MADWHYNENRNRIILDTLPKKHKRITGHRFGNILGLNPYASEFQMWCEIVGIATPPFVTNKYVEFGKVNEIKMIDFARQKFPNIMSCEEYYGNSWNDYKYSNYKDLGTIFDGVRDFVSTKNDKKTITLVGECKGASNPAKWENNNVPLDYFSQTALYTYLDKLDKMLFVATFPTAMDYNNPENYVVDETNTKLIVKRLSEFYVPMPHEDPDNSDEFKGDWTTNDVRYGNIDQCIAYCEKWWKTYVETGISPKFDETIDKEYLDIIRKAKPSNDNSLIELCNSAILLAKDIKVLKETSGLNAKEKELKVIEGAIKDTMINNNEDKCGKYTLKRAIKVVFNEAEFEKNNKELYNGYCVEKEEYKLVKDTKEE